MGWTRRVIRGSLLVDCGLHVGDCDLECVQDNDNRIYLIKTRKKDDAVLCILFLKVKSIIVGKYYVDYCLLSVFLFKS